MVATGHGLQAAGSHHAAGGFSRTAAACRCVQRSGRRGAEVRRGSGAVGVRGNAEGLLGERVTLAGA